MENTANKDGKRGSRPFPAMGFTFLIIGLALGVGTKNWAIGLPFLVLGLVFSVTKLGRDDEDADDDGDGDKPAR